MCLSNTKYEVSLLSHSSGSGSHCSEMKVQMNDSKMTPSPYLCPCPREAPGRCGALTRNLLDWPFQTFLVDKGYLALSPSEMTLSLHRCFSNCCGIQMYSQWSLWQAQFIRRLDADPTHFSNPCLCLYPLKTT